MSIERIRIKHETKTTKAGTRYQVNALYRLPCSSGCVHEWWERLTTTEQDGDFNRSEYLCVVIGHHAQYNVLYSLRADAESLNRQVEYAFHGHRLPAWGTPNQMIVMAMAAFVDPSYLAAGTAQTKRRTTRRTRRITAIKRSRGLASACAETAN